MYKMKFGRFLAPALIVFGVGGCTATGEFDMGKAASVGMGVLQASTVDENSVKQTASLAAKEMDGKSKIAGPSSNYMRRLNRITRQFKGADGLNPNFKVYISSDVNAFAMADGTVRVYSGLLDIMPDDQVAAVIGHELGHVKLRHSYKQMRETLMTNSAFKAAAAIGGTVGTLTEGQLGQLAYTAINARFSQQDELDADAYAVALLARLNSDPHAMARSIATLQAKSDGGGGFLSSHPSNDRRLENIANEIKGLQ